MDFDDDNDEEFSKIVEKLENQKNDPTKAVVDETVDFKDDDDDEEEMLKVLEEVDQNYDASINKPSIEHIQCLENSFGHSSFRPSQWNVIRSIIEDKRDNCAIMATGYGKSLLFQFPPVFLNGISFIVSPLISLMQDQVDSLNMVQISACMFGSAQSNKFIEEDVIRGDYRVVYASPEYITGSGSNLIGKLKNKLTLIAIDEAHCVSKWGPDFRPKYLELKNIRVAAPNIPILAVTATASDRVQQDICTALNLRNPQITCTGFDRPNLEIIVRRKTKEPWKDIEMILRSKQLATASVIVYCLTRKKTDQICDELQRHGLKCGAYHAGKTQTQRKEVYDKFVRDEINIVVATVAFGMGIDKSDVRCVIHYGTPADIDSYYQEIGRAGRDGVQSKCVLFFSEADIEVHRILRVNLTGTALRNAEERMQLMSDFIYTKECRRLKILQYFDGPSAKCPKLDVCCDNCRIAKNPSDADNSLNQNKEVDFAKDTKILLEAINLFNGNSGLSKPLAILRGSKAKSIERFHNHKLLGSGKFKSEEYWKIFADLLEREGFLERKNVKGFSIGFVNIQLSSKGRQWLTSVNNETTLKLVPSERMVELMKSAISTSTATSSSSVKPLYDTSLSSPSLGTLPIAQSANDKHRELRNSLMTLRATIAQREGTMPYKIALEPAIDRLVRLQPLNLEELRNAKVEGFSEAIIKQFGHEFLQCIQRSKGLLPIESTTTQKKQEQESVVSVSDPCITSELTDNIRHGGNESVIQNVKDAKTTYQDFFNDDDDLFMNIDCVQESSSTKIPEKNDEGTKRLTKITKTVSKRIKYDSCSSDDNDIDTSTHHNKDKGPNPQLSSPNPPKQIGIRKRNIF